MKNKLKLTGIELETKDGTIVKLTLAEAKDLHDQLHELFGVKYVPSKPVIIERDRWPYYPRPYFETQPWCSGSISDDSKLTAKFNSGLNVTYCGDTQ